MTPICNDILTRVRDPFFGKNWPADVFRVGDKGNKNGMPYMVKGFGAYIKWRAGQPQFPALVWKIIKYRGSRAWKWDSLLIGDTTCFHEKLVFGGPHRNPIFTHLWPKEKPQPA